MNQDTPVNICFVSGHFFGFSALKGLIESSHFIDGQILISLLVSLDNVKRGRTVGFHDFSGFASDISIPHLIVPSAKTPEIHQSILDSKPNYLLVIGWSELIPPHLLDIPKSVCNSNQRHAPTHGCIGMHPTLLPRGQGRAPIPWTIIKGLTMTGVTAFLLEESADQGGIISQENIVMDATETAKTLFAKCAEAHKILGKKVAPLLAERRLTWVDQDTSIATVWPKRTPEDGIIHFTDSVAQIHRLVRAVTHPYPGAFFYYKGRKIILLEATARKERHDHIPGTVVRILENSLPVIAAADGFLECVKIDFQEEPQVFEVATRVDGC